MSSLTAHATYMFISAMHCERRPMQIITLMSPAGLAGKQTRSRSRFYTSWNAYELRRIPHTFFAWDSVPYKAAKTSPEEAEALISDLMTNEQPNLDFERA